MFNRIPPAQVCDARLNGRVGNYSSIVVLKLGT